MDEIGEYSRNHNSSFETYQKEKGVGSINAFDS